MSDKTRDMECPNCGRTVVEAVNYHSSLGTCVFCDLNRARESTRTGVRWSYE